MWTAFEYLYRDAANFKAFGVGHLKGALSSTDEQLIRDRLLGGEFFIAEQVSVPPLYRQLYKWSNGPTKDDHCWHEFIGFQPTNEPTSECLVVPSVEFVVRFAAVSYWEEALSPHFEI